jgi:hypothetical protein
MKVRRKVHTPRFFTELSRRSTKFLPVRNARAIDDTASNPALRVTRAHYLYSIFALEPHSPWPLPRVVLEPRCHHARSRRHARAYVLSRALPLRCGCAAAAAACRRLCRLW